MSTVKVYAVCLQDSMRQQTKRQERAVCKA